MKKSELKALIREVVREAYFGAAGMAHASNKDSEQRRRDAEKDAAKKKPKQHPTPEELAAAKKKLADLPDEDWDNYRSKK